MNFQNITVQIEGGIGRVTINRPQALNALNHDVLKELIEAFTVTLCVSTVRGVIVTGSGDKAFVAGADIAQMKNLSALQADEFCRLGHQCMRTIETFERPVIAAVNGFALGGGLELALSCDFIFAVKGTKLGLPEVGLGLFPGFGGTQRLSRLVGRNRAKELIFTADLISADEALALGIVNKVVEPADLLKTAEDTLKKIFTKGPVAVALAKKVINEGSDLPLTSGLAFEAAQFPLTFATEDRSIGVNAFLEKKKPEFVGK
jgi:enoyl-CoA hydratase